MQLYTDIHTQSRTSMHRYFVTSNCSRPVDSPATFSTFAIATMWMETHLTALQRCLAQQVYQPNQSRIKGANIRGNKCKKTHHNGMTPHQSARLETSRHKLSHSRYWSGSCQAVLLAEPTVTNANVQDTPDTAVHIQLEHCYVHPNVISAMMHNIASHAQPYHAYSI